MKTGRTLAVTWLVFGLGVAACKGNLHTGTEDLSDAGQGGSTGGLGTGGIVTGGNVGSGGTGGVRTGGIATGGMIGGGGMVDAGSAGSMCNGLPLPTNPVGYPVCAPMSTMVVCITCEGRQHPECAGVCVSSSCWDCGSIGWSLSAVDCARNCNADAGRDGAGGSGGAPAPTGGIGAGGAVGGGGSGGVATGGMGTGGSSGGTAGQSATGATTAGGVAGATVGGTGGTSGSNSCGTHDQFGPRLAVRTIGSAGGDPYDGPAIVEGSTSQELRLYFVLTGATGGTGGTGPDGGLPVGNQEIHVSITGLDPMPLLASGAELWLSKNPAGNQESEVLMYGIAPWSLSARNRQGGDLLFGAARNQFDTAASPVRIGTVTPDCTALDVDPYSCTPGASTTYSSVEVEADTPVVIHDSVPGTVTLGGIEYDVRATVQQLSSTRVVCMDHHDSDYSGVALDIRAKNLADLVAGSTGGSSEGGTGGAGGIDGSPANGGAAAGSGDSGVTGGACSETPIDASQAATAYTAYRLGVQPDLSPSATFVAEELNVPGLWEALQAQLFAARWADDTSSFQVCSFVYRHCELTVVVDGNVMFGQIVSGVVANGALYYSWQFGSGIFYSSIGKVASDGSALVEAVGPFYSLGAPPPLVLEATATDVLVYRAMPQVFNVWSTKELFGTLKDYGDRLAILDSNGQEIPGRSH